MHTTEPLTRPHGPAATESGRGAPPHGSRPPTFAEVAADIVPVIGVILVAGPPVIFIAGPWVLLCLMLTAPFAVLVAYVAIPVAAAALLATLIGICATPYLVLRGLHRRHRTSRAIAVSGLHVASLDSPRAVA
jgi:hypothetical protein